MDNISIVRSLIAYRDFIHQGKFWYNIKTISDDFSIVESDEVTDFNIYEFLHNKYGITLNALSALAFIRKYGSGIGEELEGDDNPTGFMDDTSDKQLVLRNLTNGRASVFENRIKTMGRSSSKVDIIVSGQNVGRFHCSMFLDNGVPAIRDENSKNGTRVNGEKIQPGKPYHLRVGDNVVLADIDFLVEEA